MNTGAQRVLLVGEDPTLASALAASLGRRGHHVEIVRDAQEARARAVPDVLVAALEPTAADLSELLREWRRAGAAPRALWLAEIPGPDALRWLSTLGGALLVKPLRMSEFLSAVEDAEARVQARAAWRRPTRPDAVELVARDLIAFGAAFGLGPAVRARIAGAAGELVENAARHAFPDGAGEIELRVELGDGALWLAVEDRGLGFHAPPFLPPDGGLARAAALCESFSVDSAPGAGTKLALRFDLRRLELEGAPLFDLSDHDFLSPGAARELLDRLRRDPHGAAYVLPPALAVIVGRLLAGSEPEIFLGGTRCVSSGS